MFVAINQGWKHIIIEGDCKGIIDAMNRKCNRGFHIHSIIDNNISLGQVFSAISFMFCFRECNEVAHRLARWAISGISDTLWGDNVPVWLKDVLYPIRFPLNF